jgi:hypothetical protein
VQRDPDPITPAEPVTPDDPITPDGKDWTWVLEQPCPECGFDAAAVDPTTVGDLVRVNAAGWADVLQRGDVRDRPRAGVWSPLEYACHVRDVFDLFATRLALMLDEDAPRFANWDQDETAVAARYREQDPATVAQELDAVAHVVAAAFDAVADDQWDRRGSRSDGAEFTVASFATYFIHDPVHHLHDVGG